MTNTRQLKVTPEIAARLRRGEHVSPEEIDAAVRAAEAKHLSAPTKASGTESDEPASTSASPPRRMTRSALKKASTPSKHVEDSSSAKEEVNEWIPETHLKKGPQGRRKR